MTNTELLVKIKAEIERQEKQCPMDTYEGRHKLFILGYFKTFLSTFEESEKPMNQEGLEEEMERFMSNLTEQKGVFPPLTRLGFKAIARHFAKWGAEHLKK